MCNLMCLRCGQVWDTRNGKALKVILHGVCPTGSLDMAQRRGHRGPFQPISNRVTKYQPVLSFINSSFIVAFNNNKVMFGDFLSSRQTTGGS